jgi:hypothetical protein
VLQLVERLSPGPRGDDVEAEHLQYSRHALAHRLVIIDDKDGGSWIGLVVRRYGRGQGPTFMTAYLCNPTARRSPGRTHPFGLSHLDDPAMALARRPQASCSGRFAHWQSRRQSECRRFKSQ